LDYVIKKLILFVELHGLKVITLYKKIIFEL